MLQTTLSPGAAIRKRSYKLLRIGCYRFHSFLAYGYNNTIYNYYYTICSRADSLRTQKLIIKTRASICTYLQVCTRVRRTFGYDYARIPLVHRTPVQLSGRVRVITIIEWSLTRDVIN